MIDKWICAICDYIHEGEKPPPFCSTCYASRMKFEPVSEAGEITPAVEQE